MPDALLATLIPATARQPALQGFLLRKAAAERPGTRAHLLEQLRAEIDWSVADWKRLNPAWNGWNHEAEHIAAGYRLPHEKHAARALNAHGHMVGLEYSMRMAAGRKDSKSFAADRPQLRKALKLWRAAVRDWAAARESIEIDQRRAA